MSLSHAASGGALHASNCDKGRTGKPRGRQSVAPCTATNHRNPPAQLWRLTWTLLLNGPLSTFQPMRLSVSHR